MFFNAKRLVHRLYIEFEYSGIPTDDAWILRVTYRSEEYKEIKQVRAYDVQSLIGNAGGYIGLILGCSIRELPFIFGLCYKMICNALDSTIHG